MDEERKYSLAEVQAALDRRLADREKVIRVRVLLDELALYVSRLKLEEGISQDDLEAAFWEGLS